MGNTPSLPGLGGGRTHGMRYHDADGSLRGRRPEEIQAENMETQLLESIEEESVGRDNEIEVLEPSVSHNGASNVGLSKCSVMEGETTPIDEVARQMGRQAMEVFTVENEVVKNGNGRCNKTMCKEVTSSGYEQRERDENWPFRGCRKDCLSRQSQQSQSDSDSVESVHPPDRRSPIELGRH